MIPLRLRRHDGTADVVAEIEGRAVGEVIGLLGFEPVTPVDGRLVSPDAAATEVFVPGSEVGGPVDVHQPAAWELTIAAGPGSGRRYRLRPGRYSIGSSAGSSIRIEGLPEGNVDLTVTEDHWDITSPAVERFDAADRSLVRINSTWVEIGRSEMTARRRGGRVNRPPRFVPPEPDGSVAIPPAEDLSHRKREMRWSMFIGPVLVGGLMAFFFQPLFALFALFGPVAAMSGWIEDRIKTRRSGKKQGDADQRRIAAYFDGCVARAHEVEQLSRQQPALPAAVRVAVEARPELWERRSDHPDAGMAVIGYGSRPLGPRPSPEPSELKAVAAETRVAAVPISVRLGNGRVTAVVDPERSSATPAAIVAQMAVWRGPADLRVAVVTDAPGRWEWVKWLPHVVSDPVAGTRLLASSPKEVEAVMAFCRDAPMDVLLVVDVADPVALALHDVFAAPRVASIVVVSRRDSIPGSATEVIIEGTLRDVGKGEVARFDSIEPDPGVLDLVARSLAACVDPERRVVGSSMPATVGLQTIEPGCSSVAAITERWQESSDALDVVLGVGENGRLLLDLVHDGPHALVAGTTGSGKSELLRTLVAGLASRHSPEDVNFVLVDYKGGSAFDACAELPHVVGVVTDLDGRLAERAKVSLEAELRRREHRLRERGADDIAHYRRLGGSDLPRLVIVVDEFAALASEVPSFMEAVIDFAQRGRSLGVHLVLATQRPAGVVSESIRANTNLRISLRVQSEADARDVINDPAPAGLPRHLPGRAFLKAGPGDLRALQTASVTCASDSAHFSTAPFGFAMYPATRPVAAEGRDLDGIVTAIREAGESHAAPFRPWQPPLPDAVAPEDLPRPIEGVAVGVEDVPEQQTRQPWIWNPATNLALLGTPQSGPSEVLTTVVSQVVSNKATDDVGVYVIAGAGRSWSEASGIPQIGDVVTTAESSRLQRLIARLTDEVETRRHAPWVSRILVAVDGLESVLRALERAHAAREAFLALAATGPAVGITMVVVANRVGALPTAMSAAITERLVFELADPFEYSAIGLRPDRQPARLPGRCVDPRRGHEIQMGMIDLALVTAQPSSLNLEPIGQLPVVCKPDHVAEAAVFDADWFLPIGIGDERLTPVGWTVGPGEHALIIGSPRSGKSTLLAGLGGIALGAGIDVVVIAPPRSPLHEVAELDVHTALERRVLDRMSRSERALLLVDDAFRVPPDGFSQLIDSRPDCRIVASVRPEDLRNGYSHWTKPLRDLRTGVVLGPRSPADGELLGAGLPRDPDASLAGRGYIVGDGRVELCQTMCG